MQLLELLVVFPYKMKNLLRLGWIAPIFFIIGSLVLGYLLPGYNLVAQTLSEIGEVGSPFYIQWLAFDFIVAILMLLFSIGILLFSRAYQLSYLPGIFLLCFSLCQLGSSFFPSPHPLHNVFGASALIGYSSPLLFFLCWKNIVGKTFKWISLLVFLLMIIGTILNLNPLFDPLLFSMEYYGLAQRFIVYTFYLYCAYLSISSLQYIGFIKE